MTDAVARGAVAIVSEERPPVDLPPEVAWIRVREARKSLAVAAREFFRASGRCVAAGGGNRNQRQDHDDFDDRLDHQSVGREDRAVRDDRVSHAGGRLSGAEHNARIGRSAGILAEIRDAGGRYAVLEASSHSLSMDRLWGCHFAAAVFTNLTREHMDYHKNFDDYFAAKRRLFDGTGAGAPDVCDPQHRRRIRKAAGRLGEECGDVRSGIRRRSTTKKFQLTFSGLSFTAQTPNGKVQVSSRLVGRINVYNILAAIGAAQALGLSNEAIEAGIREPRKRLGPIPADRSRASRFLWWSTTRTPTTRWKI